MSITYPDARGPHRVSVVPSALLAFPIASFGLALLTDIAYWASANLMWQNFSAWLLFAGLVAGGIAVLWWLVRRAMLRGPTVWPVAGVNLLVLVAAFVNSLVHAGDGWTAVVPWGLALSALTVCLMIVSGLLGATTIRHQGA